MWNMIFKMEKKNWINLRSNKTPTWCNKMQIFITADFLCLFWVSSAHHQEYKSLTQQPLVQVVTVAGRSLLHCIRDETVVSSLIWCSEDLPTTITTCTGGCCVSDLYSWWWALDAQNKQRKSAVIKICTLLHHVGVLFDLILWSTETRKLNE